MIIKDSKEQDNTKKELTHKYKMRIIKFSVYQFHLVQEWEK